jgi:hypothetical protein
MAELFHGPVANWAPTPEQSTQIEQFLNSDNELSIAYGKVYSAGCFVKEFASIAAVGEMQTLATVEFRTGEEVNLDELSMGDCMALGMWPGTGETREAAVLNGLQQVLEARQEDPDALSLFGQFSENGYKVEAYMPRTSAQPRQWTIKVYNEGDDEALRIETVPMLYEPVFGPDVEDKAALEERVDSLMRELAK